MIVKRTFALISKSGIIPVEVQVNTVGNDLEVIYEIPDDSFQIMGVNLIPGQKYKFTDNNNVNYYAEFDDMDDSFIYVKNAVCVSAFDEEWEEEEYEHITGVYNNYNTLCRLHELKNVMRCTQAEEYALDIIINYNDEVNFGDNWTKCVNYYNEILKNTDE